MSQRQDEGSNTNANGMLRSNAHSDAIRHFQVVNAPSMLIIVLVRVVCGSPCLSQCKHSEYSILPV